MWVGVLFVEVMVLVEERRGERRGGGGYLKSIGDDVADGCDF